MANDRQSLVNYETILCLWDASDADKMQFLARLSPEQRTQFCDVLRDVLNNPWEGRSAIKLTKLNKILGQNIDLIKERVQFSGDRTPDLDEKQLYHLLHDYLVLNHDGTRSLTKLGHDNLANLLKMLDAEFETYYGRDQTHPELMWNGFQNDTKFPGAGMAKSQVEPTDYGELNAKITNYYYPSGGGGGGTPSPKDEEHDGREERENSHDEDFGGYGNAISAKWMHLLYLPFLLGYSATAIYMGFFKDIWFVGVLFGLGTAFAAVKWYNLTRFAMRGWAALLQGAWIVYLMLATSLAEIVPLAIANLIWPVAAFWLLSRFLHGETEEQKKFSAIWTLVLAGVCAVSSVGVVINHSPSRTYGDDSYDGYYVVPKSNDSNTRTDTGNPDASRTPSARPSPTTPSARPSPTTSTHSEPAPEALKAAVPHIEVLRAKPGGLKWNALLPGDQNHLTPDELDYLRKQLTIRIRYCYRSSANSAVSVTSMEGLSPSPNSKFRWRSLIKLDRDFLIVRKDDFGLGMAEFSVVGDRYRAGAELEFDFNTPYESGISFFVHEKGKPIRDGQWLAYLDDGPRNNFNLILDNSDAFKGMKRLKVVVDQIKRRIETDKLIAAADGIAAKRLQDNKALLGRFRSAVDDMCRKARQRPEGSSTIITTLPETLEQMIWRQEHPGELTEREKRLKNEWTTLKTKSLAEISRIQTFVKEKTATPYRYNAASAAKLDMALRNFQSAVANDDFLEAPKKYDIVKEAFSEFESSCRWQSGVSRGDGYRSGVMAGQWELEPGYEMVNGRPMKVSICRTCNGSGSVTKRERCSECTGSGQVQNPAAMAKDIGGLFGVKVPVNVPKYIRCSNCNGSGSLSGTYRCSSCDGRGKTYR